MNIQILQPTKIHIAGPLHTRHVQKEGIFSSEGEVPISRFLKCELQHKSRILLLALSVQGMNKMPYTDAKPITSSQQFPILE